MGNTTLQLILNFILIYVSSFLSVLVLKILLHSLKFFDNFAVVIARINCISLKHCSNSVFVAFLFSRKKILFNVLIFASGLSIVAGK